MVANMAAREGSELAATKESAPTAPEAEGAEGAASRREGARDPALPLALPLAWLVTGATGSPSSLLDGGRCGRALDGARELAVGRNAC